MVQLSKILHSRDNWKHTTIECRYEIREFKKTKQRHLKKIAELKQENRELKQQALEVKKTRLSFKEKRRDCKNHRSF